MIALYAKWGYLGIQVPYIYVVPPSAALVGPVTLQCAKECAVGTGSQRAYVKKFVGERKRKENEIRYWFISSNFMARFL